VINCLVPEAYETVLKITGIDGVGIVSKITDIISKDLQVNMKSISFESFDGTFEGNLTVFLNDTSHLQGFNRQIESHRSLYAGNSLKC
jgi:guanosine-3',5'-bis(diphosphate) 3'-pyrophosphohydrolase